MSEDSKPRTTADPLTIAYMAIGAQEVLDCNKEGGRVLVAGQLDFIGDVIEHAKMLDDIADGYTDFSGVFCYEVAEPFGQYLANLLLLEDTIDVEKARAEATKLVRAIVDEPEVETSAGMNP